MRYIFRTSGVLLVTLIIFGWIFWADGFAVDKNYQYRPLANGWVSFHALNYLKNDKSLVEKATDSITDDLTHGRFRPVFFLYVTTSYALSPLVHGRGIMNEGRSYVHLVNGDLRLFSYILLASLGLSFVFMSLLIYSYTKEIVFSFIPILFIPLSPSLTENLLFNYIDSQEIPLVLWLSIWIFTLFMAVREQGYGSRAVYLFFSFLFLVLAFLTKETTLVVSIALAIVAIFIYGARRSGFQIVKGNSVSLFLASLVVAIICSIFVYTIVTLNRQGYASTGYALPWGGDLKKAIVVLWQGLSKYSLNNYYGYIPILLFLGIALKERGQTLNARPMVTHVSLLLILLLLCYGFLFILVPWKPLLIKYLFPSIFFFSFAVALSLSLLARWAKERYSNKGMLVYLALPVYIFLYIHYAPGAEINKKYSAESAAYGISVIDSLAKSIAYEVGNNPTANQSVFIEYSDYGSDAPWRSSIQWGKLQLMRILNLENELNIVSANGDEISNFIMPAAELSSFRHYDNHKMVFVSNKKGHLQKRKFSLMYKGFPANRTPDFELSFPESDVHYRLAGESLEYYSPSRKFPEFTLYKYLPSSGENAKWEFSYAASDDLFAQDLLQKGAVEELHTVTVTVQNGEIILSSTGEDPQVLLPLIKKNKGTWLVFKGDFYSNKETILQFFYKTRNKPFYNASDSKSIFLKEGENRLYFILPACQSFGRIRMDPGSGDATRLIMRSLQVREIKDSKYAEYLSRYSNL